MKPCFLVCDQGSSSSRAFTISAEGTILSSSQKPLRPDYPAAGLAQYDPEQLLKTQLDAADEALAALPADCNPLACAITAQRSSFVLWDKKTGETLSPVISWQDGRGTPLMTKCALSQEAVHMKTGLYKNPYFAAAKIAWCLQNLDGAKQALERGTLLAGPVPSYILWHMTGGKVFAADPTHAQRTLLFNITNFSWDAELLAAFGIPQNILPQVLPCSADYGVFEKYNMPVTCIIGDQQAAFIGAGGGASSAVANYGTGAFFSVGLPDLRVRVPGLLVSVAKQDAGGATFIMEGPVNAASSVLDWLNSLGFAFSHDETDALCAASKHPVTAIPALGGLGAPYWNYKVKTAFNGLVPSSGKADIVRGCVEGIAMLVREIAEPMKQAGLRPAEVLVSGGLSKSDFLLQFQADILGLPVVRLEEAELSALGAAKLSAAFAGQDTAKMAARPAKKFIPSPDSKTDERIKSWKKFLTAVIAAAE